jgi:hypothetical protein
MCCTQNRTVFSRHLVTLNPSTSHLIQQDSKLSVPPNNINSEFHKDRTFYGPTFSALPSLHFCVSTVILHPHYLSLPGLLTIVPRAVVLLQYRPHRTAPKSTNTAVHQTQIFLHTNYKLNFISILCLPFSHKLKIIAVHFLCSSLRS